MVGRIGLCWVLLVGCAGGGHVGRATAEAPLWWGVATSSYQTEEPVADPADPAYFLTDWDLFARRGRITQGRGRGTESYRRVARDLKALSWLGVSHYRFGVEWARVEPRPGVYDEGAIRHYVALAQALRDRGIEPVVCLWHFTFPDWGSDLDAPERHGWLHPRVKARWGPYVARMLQAFGNTVRLVAPQNEPNAQAMAGYVLGVWPPGVKGALGLYQAQTDAAAQAFVEAAALIHVVGGQVLTIQNIISWKPDSGDVPGRLLALAEDYNYRHLDRVAGVADLVGFNYYYRRRVSLAPVPEQVWPRGLHDAIVDLQTRYGKPIVITENGVGTDDDAKRREYLTAHVHQVALARREGWDVRGYFFWSLVDNFEWARGYDVRYGLYALDPESGALVPKPSAALFRDLARGRKEPLGSRWN